MFWITWFPMLLQSIWDVCVLVEGLMNIEHGAEVEYIVGFVALNWRIILLRFALWRLRSNDAKYVQLLGGLGWFAAYLATGRTHHKCDGVDTVFNTLELQMGYQTLSIVSAILGILWEPRGYIAVYLEDNTLWTRCEDAWQGFAWRGTIGAKPTGTPAFGVRRSRVDALCRFLKDATPKRWDPTDARTLYKTSNTMRF